MDKKKIGIIITIIVVTLLVIIGAFTFLYFMTDIFKSSQELFWKYTSNSTQLTEVLSSENETNQKEWKENHSYTSKGDLNISVTKETGTKEIKLGTTAKHDQTTGRTYADITLYNGEEENLKVSYINNDDIYALYCKDIYEPYYIGFRNSNLKELVGKISGINAEMLELPDSISLTNVINQLTSEEKQYLLDTYSNIVSNSISQDKYSKTEKTKIVIHNQNYESVGYHLDLTNDDIRQIMMNVLTKAKEDEQTITILSKVLTGVDGNIIKSGMEELLNKFSKATTPISYLKFSVYPINKNIMKFQMIYNQTMEFTIDIDTSKENKKNVMLSTRDTNTGSGIEIASEKQILNNMIIYTTNVKKSDSEYELTMNTSLGNVIDNKIENNSKITIFDKEATIETNYYQTMQEASEEMNIEELTNTSAVIINNYPREQLENFFASISEKTEKVIPEKMEKLNIRMTDTQDGLFYLQGIISSAITIMNTNVAIQPVGIVSVTAMAKLNQVLLAMQNENTAFNGTSNITQEQQVFNNQFEIYKGDVVNGTIVKTLITTVINSNESNADNEERIVSIKITGNKTKRPSGWNESGEKEKTKLSQLSDDIQRNEQYTINIEYNQKRLVNKIIITEV